MGIVACLAAVFFVVVCCPYPPELGDNDLGIRTHLRRLALLGTVDRHGTAYQIAAWVPDFNRDVADSSTRLWLAW